MVNERKGNNIHFDLLWWSAVREDIGRYNVQNMLKCEMDKEVGEGQVGHLRAAQTWQRCRGSTRRSRGSQDLRHST